MDIYRLNPETGTIGYYIFTYRHLLHRDAYHSLLQVLCYVVGSGGYLADIHT